MDSQKANADELILRNRVSRFLSSRARLKAPLISVLRRFSERRLHAVIFGGTLRDLMVHGPRTEPRDVDVVVDGASVEDLARLFQDVVVRRTRFGGLHLNVKGWMVDVWPLSDTWALRELGIGSRDFQALTRTTFLNIEAVVIDLTNRRRVGRKIYSSGFFEAVRTRTLDINLEENPFPELSAIRTLITASTVRYGLSRRLARYVVHHLSSAPLECFVDVQLSHYGRARLGTETLYAWLKIIREQISTQAIIRVPLEPAQLPLWKDDPVFPNAAGRS
jgi:hypothetical protein